MRQERAEQCAAGDHHLCAVALSRELAGVDDPLEHQVFRRALRIEIVRIDVDRNDRGEIPLQPVLAQEIPLDFAVLAIDREQREVLAHRVGE